MNPLIAAFTVDRAAKLTGLSEAQLRRWDADGLMSPSLGWENRRRPNSRIYNFSDLVALRTLASLKSAGVSTQQLRKIRKFLEPLTDDPWNRTFYLNRATGEPFFSWNEATVAANPPGQTAMVQVVELGEIASDVKMRIERLQSRSGVEGQIDQNRYVQGGAPVFSGTRILVKTIQDFIAEGASDEEILIEYPRLTLADLDSARALMAA